MKRYKFMYQDGKTLKAKHGSERFTIGEWQHIDGIPKLCKNGYHCSKGIYNAFNYIQGDVLAVVEVKGKSDKQSDKECYTDMRITKAYKWTKKDSVALAIFSAELCIDQFEKLQSGNKRPRNAIDAAKAVLLHDTEKNRYAAESAAWSAWSAARSARYAAESAARYAARSAARSASYAAESAAEYAAESAAEYAARSAAKEDTLTKIEKWFKEHIKELEEITHV